MDIVTEYGELLDSDLQLEDFPVYGTRIRFIQETMSAWRPLRIFDLMHRPYGDPVPYYGFWFAVLFGLIGIVGVGLTFVQTVLAFKHKST